VAAVLILDMRYREFQIFAFPTSCLCLCRSELFLRVNPLCPKHYGGLYTATAFHYRLLVAMRQLNRITGRSKLGLILKTNTPQTLFPLAVCINFSLRIFVLTFNPKKPASLLCPVLLRYPFLPYIYNLENQ
jgi:hypothetical protein